VVGVDGFEPSKAALRGAIDEATDWCGSRGRDRLAYPGRHQRDTGRRLADYLQDARAVLTESITESSTIDSGVEIRCYVVEGRAGQALVDAAEGAGLPVVGCRGHGDLTETMLGSVAQFCCITRLARSSSCAAGTDVGGRPQGTAFVAHAR